MTGGVEKPEVARKGQQVFVPIVFALHAGKTVVQIAAIQITVDDFLDIGTGKSILSFKPFLIDLEKWLQNDPPLTGNNLPLVSLNFRHDEALVLYNLGVELFQAFLNHQFVQIRSARRIKACRVDSVRGQLLNKNAIFVIQFIKD